MAYPHDARSGMEDEWDEDDLFDEDGDDLFDDPLAEDEEDEGEDGDDLDDDEDDEDEEEGD